MNETKWQPISCWGIKKNKANKTQKIDNVDKINYGENENKIVREHVKSLDER